MPANGSTGDERAEADCEDQTDTRASFDGPTDRLFTPDGSLRSAGDVKRQTTEEPSSPAEWLEAVAPGRLAHIDANLDELPGTRTDLINAQIRDLIREAEADGRTITPQVGSEISFLTTEHQEERAPLGGGPGAAEGELALASRTDRCSNCEAEVAVTVVIRQLRAADEAGTRIYKGACGCTWREDD